MAHQDPNDPTVTLPQIIREHTEGITTPQPGEGVTRTGAGDTTTIFKVVAGQVVSREVPTVNVTIWARNGWSTANPNVNVRGLTRQPERLGGGPREGFEPGQLFQFGPNTLTDSFIVFRNNTDDLTEVTIGDLTFTVEPGAKITYKEIWETLDLPQPDGAGRVAIPKDRFERIYGDYIETVGSSSFDLAQQALLDGLAGIGGGGRKGPKAPVYVPPDRRLVEDAIKGTLVALTGKNDPVKLQQLTDKYMSESKRAFGLREREQIDPMATIRAEIRALPEYKAVHKLRPESADEFDWVSKRQGALVRAGLTESRAEQLGIDQATVGASVQSTVKAGETARFQEKRQVLPGLLQDFEKAASAAIGLL